MKVQKAVILAAGSGTRFLPITKSLPKAMLTIVDKPAIQYVVEEIVEAGIRDILIVVSPVQEALRRYFTVGYDTQRLMRRGLTYQAEAIKKIDEYYADSYDDIAKVLGIVIPQGDDINAYLSNGNTLIISVVRNRRAPMSQRKEKIRWLISIGADINRRDSGKYYFPPLSHSVQNGDFEMFKFLLHECKANPNIGSRNPHDAGKIRQKNDGNMPLMIAAWDNKLEYVKELCNDPRISINQQDGNGFTALIKACYWGWLDCRDILIAHGADTKIVDRDGYTAEDRYNEYLETGRRKNTGYNKKPNGGNHRRW